MEHFYVFVVMLSGEEVKKAIKSLDSVGFALTKDVHLKPHGISMARAAWKALRQDLLKDVSALGLLQGDRTALRVLQEREEALRVAPSNSSFQQAKLASLLDLKGEHLEAKELLKGCSTSTCEQGEQAAIGFLQHLVLQHVRWQEERAMITDTNSVTHIRRVPVETVSAEVSGEEIWERFVKPGIPCVVRGVRLAPLRTLDDLAPLGSVQIPMRRCNENSTNWARLEADGMIRFDDFLETFIAPFQHSHSGQAPRNSPQLFDFSIWQHCAKTLGNQVLMPSKWFPVDLYTYASVKMQPISGSAGPTLFVAPAGSGSSLHVDLREGGSGGGGGGCGGGGAINCLLVTPLPCLGKIIQKVLYAHWKIMAKQDCFRLVWGMSVVQV